MKIFDMHCDIGTSLYDRYLLNEKDVFRKYHLDDLLKGDIKGVCAVCYFRGTEDWDFMQKLIKHCNEEIEKFKDYCHIVKTKEDIKENDKILTFIAVEGMCGVDSDVEKKIEWLYQNNVRVATLVWNESNHLADGWPKNPLRGLSEDGFKVVKKMNELNMIIDVSHINEKGFWDVISASKKPIIATHSNARKLCSHERNLTDQQIKAIASKGGLIGLNSCSYFISDDKNKQNAHELAKHAKYIADLVGVEHVACGFDFMNFLLDYNEDENAVDLKSAADAQNLIKALKDTGFNDEEISKIAYYNAYNFLKEQL